MNYGRCCLSSLIAQECWLRQDFGSQQTACTTTATIFSPPYTNMARYSLSRVIASTLRGAKANSRSLAKIPLPETKPATWRQDGATVKGSVTHSLYLLTPSKAIGQFQRLEPDATTRTPCFFSFFFFSLPPRAELTTSVVTTQLFRRVFPTEWNWRPTGENVKKTTTK